MLVSSSAGLELRAWFADKQTSPFWLRRLNHLPYRDSLQALRIPHRIRQRRLSLSLLADLLAFRFVYIANGRGLGESCWLRYGELQIGCLADTQAFEF